jgi:hypothetical protein
MHMIPAGVDGLSADQFERILRLGCRFVSNRHENASLGLIRFVRQRRRHFAQASLLPLSSAAIGTAIKFTTSAS